MRYIIERRGNELYIMERQEDGTYKLIGRSVGQDDALVEMARLANMDDPAKQETHDYVSVAHSRVCEVCQRPRLDTIHNISISRHYYQIKGVGDGVCAVCGEAPESLRHYADNPTF